MAQLEARRGDIWWADIPEPVGSGPGFRRPVLVIQADLFNATGIRTVIAVMLTSNQRMAELPGNVAVPGSACGLNKDSVVNITQVLTIDRALLTDHAGTLPPRFMKAVSEGLRMVLAL